MSVQQAKYETIRYVRSCLNIGSKIAHKMRFLGPLAQRHGQIKLFAHWVGGGLGWLWWPPKMVAPTAYTEAGAGGQNSLNRNLGKLWLAIVPHQRARGTQNFMWMYHGGMVPKQDIFGQNRSYPLEPALCLGFKASVNRQFQVLMLCIRSLK